MVEKTMLGVAMPEAAIEVVSPDGARTVLRVDQNPFLIGRGADTGNHLQLADRRISRQCAAVVFDGNDFHLEDRGQKRGLFINTDKADSRPLRDGDSISFGLPDSYELIFRTNVAALPQLLDRMEHITTSETAAGGLRKLSLLLEAVLQLHSHTPLEQILGNMVDQAIALIDADRGLLLEPAEDGSLKARVSRHRGAQNMPGGSLLPSQTALRQALTQKRGIVTEDVQLADQNLAAAHSIIAQRLRSVVVIPLFGVGAVRSLAEGDVPVTGKLMGVLYMDSRKPAAFSKLERQILDALAVEAASVLENAKLVESERDRERLEREINIARDIQRALLPREFHNYPHFEVTGSNQSCLEVGGDYFDLFDLGGGRTAFVLADVSGKGLGAALMTTMLQGALSATMLGQRPAEMIAHINQFFCQHSQIERYATMFFGVLDSNGRMEYINAGHPSPLLLRNGEVSAPFPAACCPVGLIPDTQFTSAEMQLSPGDTMVLFSDGVSEAMDPEQQEYGVDRLKLAVAPRTTAPLTEMQETILESVREFARGARQADDVTLLLLRYRTAEKAVAA